ncbi:DUF985 domain protein [Thozetella sp. PMI_491]|nr:DUF985 domain protein [Thozetella sp. PMI_491]
MYFLGSICLLASLICSTSSLSPRYSHGGPVPIDKRSAQEVITKLGLAPNVEKGYYIETFRDSYTINNRSASTGIYYLLEGSAGHSYWHRVDSVEMWHYYAGAPLNLSLSFDDGKPVRKVTLGPDVFNGQRPQFAIASWQWQRAQSLGDWTLVGTTVAPGFDESGFELAAPDWQPRSDS